MQSAVLFKPKEVAQKETLLFVARHADIMAHFCTTGLSAGGETLAQNPRMQTCATYWLPVKEPFRAHQSCFNTQRQTLNAGV